LIEGGVLKNFYYDLQTAGLAGTNSTGNGYRSLYSLPGPSLAALIVPAGEAKYGEIVDGIKEGVLIDQVMGAWAGNVLAGDFSANIHLGYKIENGEIVGRVRDTMVAGNVFQALKDSVEALGSETSWVGAGMKTPAILLGNISVSSRE
jgi:PmbA protein